MFPVQWCNLCQSKPATGILTGYFQDLQDEEIELQACEDCAKKAMNTA